MPAMLDRRRWALTALVAAATACVNLDALSADTSTDGAAGDDAAAHQGDATAQVDGGAGPSDDYDRAVLADHPVAFWDMSSTTATEPDLSGGGHVGTYKGGQPPRATLPNGGAAADFDGTGQYLLVGTSADFSISTTRKLTWEAWIRPDTFSFPRTIDGDYVHWLGKCASYSPTCEWQARIYVGGRVLTALAFNGTGGSGSGADWQPTPSLLQAGQWLHVVGEYQTATTPAGCSGAPPGSVDIWVNGVPWNGSSHRPRGCMSEANVVPTASTSPLVIGSVAFDSFFAGAIGKVAIYGTLLTQERIAAHFMAMTRTAPLGTCGSTCTIPVPTPTGP